MTWPSTLVAYKKTPTFDADTVPAGLLDAHNLKEGVWAMIRVLEGELGFVNEETDEEELLSKSNPGFIDPLILHHIVPRPGVRFYIEFFRNPAA